MIPTTNMQTRYDRIIDETKPHEFYYYPARGYGKTIELENIHVHNGNLYGNINNGAELIQAMIQESKPLNERRHSDGIMALINGVLLSKRMNIDENPAFKVKALDPPNVNISEEDEYKHTLLELHSWDFQEVYDRAIASDMQEKVDKVLEEYFMP